MADKTVVALGGLAALLAGFAFLRGRVKAQGVDPASPRGRALAVALSKVGVPYQWGGGHSPGGYGLDCSGLVIVAHQEAGLPLPRVSLPTANGMWKGLEPTDDPQPMDLAFYGYGPDKAVHVVIVTGPPDARGNYPIVGANGGDATTTTLAAAKAKNAAVREEPSHLFWSRFIGFRKNSLDDLPVETPDAAVAFADARQVVDMRPDSDEFSLA